MTRSPVARLRAFVAHETGGVSVETVIIFPLLLWAYAAMFIYWDAFKAQNVNLKATYTIADMISREDSDPPIIPDYIDGMNDLYAYLIRSDEGNDVRVSVVDFVADPLDPAAPASMCLRWSHATGSYLGHPDVTPLEDDLPILPGGSQLIVVETRMTWSPPFNFQLEPIGLDTRDMVNLVFTSPRFVPQVRWDSNSDGNPDDVACA